MRRHGLVIAVLTVAALAQFSASKPAVADYRLSSVELRRLFPGTFTAIYKNRARLSVVAEPNGRLSGKMVFGVDLGRWWITGTQLCITFSRDEKQDQKCGPVFRDGTWYIGLFNKRGIPKLRFQPQ